jgi:hypothetical protein
VKVLFICNDPDMQLAVYVTVPEAVFITFADFDAATRYIELQVSNPPDVALIDPEAVGGRHGERLTRDFLQRYSSKDSKFGAVLVLRAPGSDFEIEALRNPRVWTWDTTDAAGEADPSVRLVHALMTAASKPTTRHFRAIVSFKGDAVTLNVEENDVPVIRNWPLLTDANEIANLDAVAKEDLEPSEFDEPRRLWQKYKNSGYKAYNALFGQIGRALISNDPSDSVEFRFNMEKMQLQRHFALPLELITLVANDSHDGFLCNLRPMARSVLESKRQSANSAEIPHILFVNAGSAKGGFAILGNVKTERRRLPSIQESTDEQRQRLDDLGRSGRCTLEELTLETFNAKCEARGAIKAKSFRDALERRLCQPMPDDREIDILHFAGHGISQVQSETRLVLPSDPPRQGAAQQATDADLLEVKQLAEWLPDKIRLVFLAACQTASISSAEHLHLAKNCSLVGFRWKVVAKRIPDFVDGFYDAYLRQPKSVASAYQAGCQKARLPEDPNYVSAIALAAD